MSTQHQPVTQAVYFFIRYPELMSVHLRGIFAVLHLQPSMMVAVPTRRHDPAPHPISPPLTRDARRTVWGVWYSKYNASWLQFSSVSPLLNAVALWAQQCSGPVCEAAVKRQWHGCPTQPSNGMEIPRAYFSLFAFCGCLFFRLLG